MQKRRKKSKRKIWKALDFFVVLCYHIKELNRQKGGKNHGGYI
jgi:hypothetical protein